MNQNNHVITDKPQTQMIIDIITKLKLLRVETKQTNRILITILELLEHLEGDEK